MGLEPVPIPLELAKLDALSAQLIQLAKCYQTVVRLGTYTGRVAIYNSLKACHGTMFFLPLPLKKILDTLHQVNLSGKRETALPDPELYIIVNGKTSNQRKDVKSRLLNKDSWFRKHAPYAFYLLWQKEMRELSAGVYNLMKKSNKIHQMTASSLLSNVQSNDEHLEANLCTMLQSVWGTQQYWFVRKSELKCMIREYGSPTLFLTFSYAEYDSAVIANYLRKINNVPPSYNIGKLCTEDPTSV